MDTMLPTLPPLPAPSRYFAPRRGLYEVSPGLSRLGTSFGNGAADGHVFQLDDQFPAYHANKSACRSERKAKYICRAPGFSGPLADAVARWIAERLVTEHPDLFAWETAPRGSVHALLCRATQERLLFDAQMRLTGVERDTRPCYEDAWEALGCQVQEDLAVVALPEEEADSNVALHVCAPSRWAPEEKLGRSFAETHTPVPHFERVSRAAGPMLSALLTGEPMTRFNWGIEFSDRLNLHPEPPPGADPTAWSRGGFSSDRGMNRPLYLRVERQVLWGLPEVRALVFTMRTYLTPAAALTTEERRLVASALRSHLPEAQVYKGCSAETCRIVADWLESTDS